MKDQLADGDFADFHFVVAGFSHMAAEADDARAGVVGGSQFGKRLAAARRNVFDRAQSLNVVDDGGALIKAENRWKVRRLDARIGAFAFQGFDEPRFLAANVGAGAAMQVNFQMITTAQNVFPKEAVFARFLQGVFENGGALDEFAANVDIGEADVVCVRRDGHAFQQLMRILVNDLTIFEGARLRLIGVANKIDRFAAAAVDEGPF